MSGKIKALIDYIFLGILGIFIGVCVYRHFTDGYVLYINNYVAFALWASLIFYKILKPTAGKSFVFWLLVLAMFQVINFSIGRSKLNFGYGDSNSFFIGFDPSLFLVFIMYSIIRRDIPGNIIRGIFKGSEKDQTDERNKMIGFYYKKFISCDSEELKQIFGNFNEYPVEAQIALNKIKVEKKI
jgi:hypothetical protein